MIWEILLSATISTGLELLSRAGFGDSAKDLHDKWFKTDAKKRRQALKEAFQQAVRAAGDDSLQPLLDHRPFQEEVVRALLDPINGLDLQSVAQFWGERFPEHALSVRKFFNVLQNTLLADTLWGPILGRYQQLRFQQEVIQALQAQNLPVNDAPIVAAVSREAETYRASVQGGGAVAQGAGARAVGAGGLLVEGNYIQQISQVVIQNFILRQPAESESGDLRRRYLEWTASQANLLPWTKVVPDFADPSRGEGLQLADVYIDLDTTEMRHMEREEELRAFLARQREMERISAQEAVNKHKKLLIMGDPGSGKSTFVKHLAYLMAQAALAEDPTPWLSRLSQWEHGVLFPVRLELRHLAAFAGQKRVGDAALLLAFLRAEMDDWGLSGFTDSLLALIQNPKGGVLFLLDGLDEVPTDQRQVVVNAVNDLCGLYRGHHYVVTCRPYAYVGQPWKLSGFSEMTLAPFNEEQIDRFIENWYEQLASRNRIERRLASEKAQRLKDAVRRGDLIGLAERPLLLTVMAQLHAYAGQLPEDRTQLYADAVQLLLQRWESRLSGENGILEYLGIPGLKMSDLEAGLYEVAFNAHARSVSLEGTADITEEQLRKDLQRYLNNDWNKAGQFVEYIRERAGLLIRHKTDAYTFPHRSFQEFLAACAWLAMEDYPGQAVALVKGDWDRWREVFLLAAGYAARTKRLTQAISAVNCLLPRNYNKNETPGDMEWKSALLAGQALLEIGLVGVRREAAGLALLERIQAWLIQAMQQDHAVKPKDRAEAGRVLAKLGDPRPEALTCEQMAFCHVPAVEFVYGERKEQKKMTLPEYWMGKYPVTNAQFAQFVAAGGYDNPDYWREAQGKGYWSPEGFKGGSDNAPRKAPGDFGEPFNLGNHAVVGVSWYEALAFTRWLTAQLAANSEQLSVNQEGERLRKGLCSGSLQVTLPTEEQWEKAARGEDGREYPWKGEFDPNKANTAETGIGTTTAVGCFPGGASPYGCLDMSGNVWEWTAEAGPLRGGSFPDNADLARCASRYGYFPASGAGTTVFVWWSPPAKRPRSDRRERRGILLSMTLGSGALDSGALNLWSLVVQVKTI